MKNTKAIVHYAIAGLLTVGILGVSELAAAVEHAAETPQQGEKCGVAGGMMGQGSGMMGQGMCSMCMSRDPMGMMGMMGMMGEGQMDSKTRGQILQMRGEMYKAMGDVMLKHGQALGQTK